MKVEESYGFVALAANASQLLLSIAGGGVLGGFLCQTAGSMKLTINTAGGATVVDTLAVTAGTFYPVPAAIAPGTGIWIALTGGAAGTFFLNT